MTVKIGVISPTQLTSEVVDAAFADQWPEAKHVTIIDEALYESLRTKDVPFEWHVERIRRLMQLSIESGVQGIVFTGSVFGAAVMEARKTIQVPVLTSFEAMIEEALALGSRFYLLATGAPSLKPLADDIRAAAARVHRPCVLQEQSLPEAANALFYNGDRAHQDRLIVEAVRAAPREVDAILFSQFTMGSALRAIGAHSPPVLAPAYCMVRYFRKRFAAA